MLRKTQMQEIQDLKLRGYTKTEILTYYKEQGLKPPSRPTISKYYDMDVIPEDPGKKLIKDKAFDVSPFKEAIISILEANSRKDFCISSVYDLLEEKFIENGSFDCLPENEQTLRNYVHHLEESGQIDPSDQHRRIYDHVFDTPPGEQMLIDFGEVTLSRRGSIHFICLLLRYSRILCVYAQDHKYNATKACQAIYRSFCKLGGRPAVLVIDQDAVFVASETYGEVIKTRIFGDFCTEQDLKLWVCNKADPESKGPIENSVGFVKKNFFSARTITCIDDVWRSLPGWLERKNKRIHRATLRIPMAVFRDIEKDSLRSVLPSVYETSPNSFIAYECKGTPYVLFRSCRYSVPRSYAYSVVKYKITAGKIHIYDEDLRFLCTHLLSERRGSFNQLPEHRKYYANVDGKMIEITKEVAYAMNNFYRSSQPRKVEIKNEKGESVEWKLREIPYSETNGQDYEFSIEDFPDYSCDVEDSVISSVERRDIHKVINQLDAEERMIIYSIYFENKTQVQLAGIMGVSRQVLAYKLKTILHKMRRMYQENIFEKSADFFASGQVG